MRRRRDPAVVPRYGRVPRRGASGRTRRCESPSGGAYLFWEPTGYTHGDAVPLLILCHAAGGSESSPFGAVAASTIASAQAAGYLCASALAGAGNASPTDRAWGAPHSILEYQDLFYYTAAQYNITRTVLWGASMGGLASQVLAGQGRIPGLKGLLLMYPVCSLANMYADTAYFTEINAAWGTTPYTSAPDVTVSQWDPYQITTAAYTSLRFLFFHSSGDTVVSKTRHSDLMHSKVSTVAAESTVTATSGTHGDASNWIWANCSAFLGRCV